MNATFDTTITGLEAKLFTTEGTDKIDVLNDLAWALGYQHPARAFTLGTDACEQSELLAYPKGIGYAERAMANCCWRLTDYADGLTHIARAISIFETLDERSALASSFNLLGLIHDRLGNVAEAFAAHFKSLALSQEIHDAFGEAMSLTNIGIIYKRLGEYFKSLEFQLLSLHIYQSLHHERSLSQVHANIGRSWLSD
ncbi:MAG: tetratricopeptide repeat protein [Rhizobacter sp.]|nr:tetratricopeptide repeat protein [Chlorobiales bacterium]